MNAFFEDIYNLKPNKISDFIVERRSFRSLLHFYAPKAMRIEGFAVSAKLQVSVNDAIRQKLSEEAVPLGLNAPPAPRRFRRWVSCGCCPAKGTKLP